jgi:transcriptional regulatory protein GAL4
VRKGATSSVVPLRALLGQEQDGDQQTFSFPSGHSQSLFSNQLPTSLPFSNISESTFIDAYFRYYHTTYPFLHEALFRAQLQGKRPRPEGSSWTILYNAVLALGAWCIGDDDSVMDDFFYRKVGRIPEESSIFESGNLAMVQTLLLLSNYAQKRNRPNTGWNYLGLAVRMALSLGLHKEFPNWEITHLQREMRRRVWWGLFVFDSGASITFGRPVLLPERGIMDASPVLNIHEEVSLRVFKLRFLLICFKSLAPHTNVLPDEIPYPTSYTGLISQSLFHLTTNSLHHRLISTPHPLPDELLSLNQIIETWENSIPPYFQLDSPIIHANEAFLFARYRLNWRSWNLQIIIFRPVILQLAVRRKQSELSTALETSEELACREKCIQSARATINSISDFVATGMLSRLSTWYMVYFLFQAGLVPIICLLTDPTHPDSSLWLNDIRTTRDLLGRTALTNRLAARCLTVFNRLSPALDTGLSEDFGLGMWEGNFADEFLNDQFGGDLGAWDWENGEFNWTI